MITVPQFYSLLQKQIESNLKFFSHKFEFENLKILKIFGQPTQVVWKMLHRLYRDQLFQRGREMEQHSK